MAVAVTWNSDMKFKLKLQYSTILGSQGLEEERMRHSDRLTWQRPSVPGLIDLDVPPSGN